MSTGTHDAMTNGAVPRGPIVEGNTSRVTRNALQASGMSGEEFIEALASKVAKVIGGGDGNGGAPKKATGKSDMFKWLVKAVLAAALFGFSWYTTVNESIKDRPTKAQVETRFGLVEQEVRQVRESQIRSEEQTKSIKENVEAMNRVLREINITGRRR